MRSSRPRTGQLGGKHRPRWSAGQAKRWLTFLATHLHDTGSADISWWKLSKALPRLTVGLVVGGVSFLIFGLAGWFAGGRVYGAGYALAYALAFGPAGGVSYGFRPYEPSRVQFRVRGAYLTILRRCALGTLFGSHGWMKAPALADRVPSPSATSARTGRGRSGPASSAGSRLGSPGAWR